MKKLALGGMVLAAVALTGPAFAADLPPAYKTPLVVPPYSWSGFYIGANAGGSWGRDSTDYNVFGFPLFSTSQNLNGFIGGGQIGWNWQTGAWVWGVEADFQGTSQKGDIVTPIDGFGTTNDYNQKLSWLGTVRGRVGFTPAPRWLIYATGGFAYANVETTDTLTVPGVGTFSSNFSDNLTGWTVGGGVEWALWGAWTAKAEYLYVDLGSATDNGTVLAGVPAFTATNHVTDNIFRAGLNWRFGGGPAIAGY